MRRNDLLCLELMFLGIPNIFAAKVTEHAVNAAQDRLRFDTHCSKHWRIVNDGRTAERITTNFNKWDTLFTNRHLRSADNELFEIRLEDVLPKQFSIEIGVTTHRAEEFNLPEYIGYKMNTTCTILSRTVYCDDKLLKTEVNYDVDQLKVGDRLGIMRKDDGSLHLHVNGFDQGVAAEDVPDGVYGFVELYRDVKKLSIV